MRRRLLPDVQGTARSRVQGSRRRTLDTSAPRYAFLLDTNVWIDLYLPKRPGHIEAKRLVNELIAKDGTLLFAVSSIKDAYYCITATLKRAMRAQNGTLSEDGAKAANAAAWGCIENMQEIGCAVGADDFDISIARKHRVLHADFEDDLIIAAALRSEANCLVTSDAALAAHAPITALSPKGALAYLDVL